MCKICIVPSMAVNSLCSTVSKYLVSVCCLLAATVKCLWLMLRYDAQQNNVHYHSQYTCQIWFRSGLVKASYGHYGQHATRIGPGRICCQVLARNHWARLWPTLLSRSRWDENHIRHVYGNIIIKYRHTSPLLSHTPAKCKVSAWLMDHLTSCTPVLKEVNLRLYVWHQLHGPSVVMYGCTKTTNILSNTDCNSIYWLHIHTHTHTHHTQQQKIFYILSNIFYINNQPVITCKDSIKNKSHSIETKPYEK